MFWIVRILKDIREAVHETRADVKRVLRILALKRIDFFQVEGIEMITGIVAGTSGTFVAILTPSNGAQAAGSVPQWSSSEAAVSLSPAADGLSVVAAVPSDFAGTSFDLTISAASSDPAVGTVSNVHTIPVTPAPPPPPPPLTAIDFDQAA